MKEFFNGFDSVLDGFCVGGSGVSLLHFCPDVEADGFGNGFGEGFEFDFGHVESGFVRGDGRDGVDAEEGASSVVHGQFPNAGCGVNGVGVESDGADGFEINRYFAACEAEGDEART